MKMIKPSYEIYNIPDASEHNDVLMHLERIGRTCYKSEDKITTDSAIKFIKNIRDRKHWAMLEHYIFTLSIPEWIYNGLIDLKHMANFGDPEYNLKSSFLHTTYWPDTDDVRYMFMVSFSATTLNYLFESDMVQQDISNDVNNAIGTLFNFMKNIYPEIMSNYNIDISNNDSFDGISFISREEIKSLPNWIREVHDFISVKFIVDRGVSHEIVRHRPASYAQESTRYCNYSKDKFDNGITVIIPSFFDTGMGEMSNSLVFDEWKFSCESAERRYLKLLEYGAKPEQARTVLPNSLKTELVMTANLHEFRHFFTMRCHHTAHPQMREVAVPLLDELIHNEYYRRVFDDQAYLTTLQSGE